MPEQPLCREAVIAIRALPYLLAVSGAAFSALSLELCYIPHGLMDGGMTGFAVLLGQTLRLPPIYLLIPLNAACLFVGIRRLGPTFLGTTAVGLFVYGLILRLVGPLLPLFSTPVSIILGGAGVGFGIGLLLRAGGALDGCETLGLLVQARFGISVVTVLTVTNLLVFSLAIWKAGVAETLPSLIAQIVGQAVISWVVRR